MDRGLISGADEILPGSLGCTTDAFTRSERMGEKSVATVGMRGLGGGCCGALTDGGVWGSLDGNSVVRLIELWFVAMNDE